MATHVEAAAFKHGQESLSAPAKRLADAVRTLPIGHLAHDTAFIGADGTQVTWSDLRTILDVANRTPGVMHAASEMQWHLERGRGWNDIPGNVCSGIYDAVSDLRDVGVSPSPRVDYSRGL